MLASPVELALPVGHALPRLAPPTPAVSDLDGYRDVASDLGITLIPWQETAARYLEAQDADGRFLYREVGVVVARQNGKTTLLLPLIVKDLLAGRRVMHTAQDRSLPREIFYLVAEAMWDKHPELFPMRNGRPTKPRYANGQEEVRLINGGMYSIVAPTRGGARGPTRDRVIIDELREMDTWDFIAGAKSTMTVSPNAQMDYFSNAGEDDSIVLNALRDRADKDPALAYLEWSADPDRKPDDVVGWAEANPAMGNEPEGMGSVYETLVADYRTATLERTLPIFETEHLCRWVETTRPALVQDEAWTKLEGEVGVPVRPVMAVSLDPGGQRASAAIAWPVVETIDDVEVRRVHLRLLFDVKVNEQGTDRLGKDMLARSRELKVAKTGFDPLTDQLLAKHFRRTEPLTGQKFANASAAFVNLVETGRLRWEDSAAVGEDLAWTSRKSHDESGSFQAVRADDERPITAALAAIRAVYLASLPRPEPTERRPGTVGF